MSSKKWTFDQALIYLQDGTIDLDSDTIKAALVTNSAVLTHDQWAADTVYGAGDIVVPTTDNGRRYICTVAGTSDPSTEPTWPTTEGGTVVDGGTLTWQEFGGALCNLTTWSDLSAAEAANGDGYTTGGATLANLALSLTTVMVSSVAKRAVKWDADNVTWSALTKDFRYLVLYASGTLNGVTDPLIAYILLNDTPADYSANAIDFTINWNASGIHALYM